MLITHRPQRRSRDTEDDFGVQGAAATILFLPDGVASGRVGPTLSMLRQHGYVPAAGVAFQLDESLIGEIRRYTPKPSTRQAILMRQLLETAGPSIYLSLTCTQPRDYDPIVHLNRLKGSAFPWLRGEGHLRSRLFSEHPMLKFFHTPDDCQDMTREMDAYRRHRPAAFRGVATGEASVGKLIDEVEQSYRRHDLNFGEASARLVEALQKVPGGPELLAETGLASQAPRLRGGGAFEWERVRDFVLNHDVPVSQWDLLVTCACLTLVSE